MSVDAFSLEAAPRLAGVVLAAVGGGILNSIAGGGTLLTFPSLVALGVPPLVANATSTVALWPGILSSMLGYRGRLRGTREWASIFAIPSVTGGATGALLLLWTPPDRFAAIVPWLVLSATVLFALQAPVMRAIRSGTPTPAHQSADAVHETIVPSHSVPALVGQYLIAVYGGYFGAGVGILILAVLGFLGFRDIHRMNGLKNWAALCLNFVAACVFVWSGVVDWPVGIAMAAGAAIGGYVASRVAQQVPQRLIRHAILVIGVGSSLWLLRL